MMVTSKVFQFRLVFEILRGEEIEVSELLASDAFDDGTDLKTLEAKNETSIRTIWNKLITRNLGRACRLFNRHVKQLFSGIIKW